MKKELLKKISAYTLKTLAFIGTAIAAAVILPVTTLLLICRGPSLSARQLFVTTVLETGQLKFLASVFLSEDEIQAMVNQNSMKPMDEDVDTSLIKIAVKQNSNVINSSGSISLDNTASDGNTEQTPAGSETIVSQDPRDGIEIVPISGRTFYGTMLIIEDPSRVSVATTYPWGELGKNLDVIAKEAGAIAAVNGGLYASYDNTGARPYGVAVSNGQIQLNQPESWPGLYMIGLNNDNILVIKSLAGMNAAQFETYVKENGIRDAVAFQEEASDKNNHFVQLIINGEARELNGMGSGLNPRTAIGQRADGAILLLVTDGRGASGHLGASASDLINVMMEYGAVNAANLDGGSSSCMYYDEEYLMTIVTFYYSNASWRLPTAFVVK